MRKKLKSSLSALESAQKIQREVARLGFDWPNEKEVLKKIEEEIGEVRHALRGRKRARVREEIGDLLFTVAGLAQKAGFNAERTLKGANRKFRDRFGRLEKELHRKGKKFPQKLEVLDKLWNHVKRT